MDRMNVNIQRMPEDLRNTADVKKKDSKESGEEFKKLLQDKPEKDMLKESVKDKMSEKKDTENAVAVEKPGVDETLAANMAVQMLCKNLMVEIPKETEIPMQAETVETVDAMDTEMAVQQMPEQVQEQEGVSLSGVEVLKQEDAVPVKQDGQPGIPEQAEREPKVKAEGIQTEKASEKRCDAKTADVSEKEKASFTEAARNPVPEQTAEVNVGTDVVRDVRKPEQHPVYTERMQADNIEEIPQKLPQELLTQIRKGVNEFEIQIEPEHLGKIAIKVLYEHGQTTVMIACSEKQTQSLLGERANELGQVMTKNLGEDTTVLVDKQENDYLNQGQRENDHSGRESEQDRQREESRKNKTDNTERFLQKLRLGLSE